MNILRRMSFFIVVISGERDTSVNDEHPLKAYNPRLVTDFGIVIFFNDEHL